MSKILPHEKDLTEELEQLICHEIEEITPWRLHEKKIFDERNVDLSPNSQDIKILELLLEEIEKEIGNFSIHGEIFFVEKYPDAKLLSIKISQSQKKKVCVFEMSYEKSGFFNWSPYNEEHEENSINDEEVKNNFSEE